MSSRLLAAQEVLQVLPSLSRYLSVKFIYSEKAMNLRFLIGSKMMLICLVVEIDERKIYSNIIAISMHELVKIYRSVSRTVKCNNICFIIHF